MKNLYGRLLLASTLSTFAGCEVGDGSFEDGTFEDGPDISAEDAETVGRGKPVAANKFPAVVFADFCTGTLVSPNVVVTAAHCITDEINKVGELVKFGNNAKDFKKPGAAIKITDRRKHPTLDIGVLALAKNAPVKPMKMANNEVKKGDIVRLVGFGVPAQGSSVFPITKRKGVATVTDVVETIFAVQQQKPGQVSGCPGDSGGPWFNLKNELVGLHTGPLDFFKKCENAVSAAERISKGRKFINKFINEKKGKGNKK